MFRWMIRHNKMLSWMKQALLIKYLLLNSKPTKLELERVNWLR